MPREKIEYYQQLPHYQPKGAAFFVTFRLHNRIPKSKLLELKERYELLIHEASKISEGLEKELRITTIRKKYIVEYDKLLDQVDSGPTYLKDNQCQEIVKTWLHHFDNKYYELIAYTVMSNHVHILIDTSIQLRSELHGELDGEVVYLDGILKRIKAPIARYCNRMLERKGQFWARESFDIVIRNEKMFRNVITYILENPVKAGIVKHWEDYSGSYLKYY